MYKQSGLNVLEFECCVLDALNKKDYLEIQAYKELALLPEDIIENQENNTKDIADARKIRYKEYEAKLNELKQNHDPQSKILSYDALEFLYQKFLETTLPSILRDIESFYDKDVQHLLQSGAVHFTAFAHKIAKYNLRHHAVGDIIYRCLSKHKEKQLNQVISLLPYKFLNSFQTSDIEFAISQKYEYFADRIVNCPEIGQTINSL